MDMLAVRSYDDRRDGVEFLGGGFFVGKKSLFGRETVNPYFGASYFFLSYRLSIVAIIEYIICYTYILSH